MIKAILWDNDGVLIDTEEVFFRATRDALREAGVELDLKLYIQYALQRGRSCFELLPPEQCASTSRRCIGTPA
jgi:beta-phosphoglucomutase-like phosphatase (HAD superfamily)